MSFVQTCNSWEIWQHMSLWVRFKIFLTGTCNSVSKKAEERGYPVLIGSQRDHGLTWITTVVIFTENVVLQLKVRKGNDTEAW